MSDTSNRGRILFLVMTNRPDKLDVDLFAAVQEKMVLNREKYPAEQVRGDARKYYEYKKQTQAGS